MGSSDRRIRLNLLEAEEKELEQLRMLVDPVRWPRIYAMLKRIREQINREEANSDGAGGRAA